MSIQQQRRLRHHRGRPRYVDLQLALATDGLLYGHGTATGNFYVLDAIWNAEDNVGGNGSWATCIDLN